VPARTPGQDATSRVIVSLAVCPVDIVASSLDTVLGYKFK
jgi:hypothetical protein